MTIKEDDGAGVTIGTGSGETLVISNLLTFGQGTHTLPGSSSDWTVISDGDGTATLTTSLSGTLNVLGPNGTIEMINLAGAQEEMRVQSGTVLDFSDKTVFVENADNANIARLYEAALGRLPDANGLASWDAAYQNLPDAAKAAGVYQSLAQTNDGAGMSIAAGFLQSTEFQAKYGNLTDAAFVTQLYTNVLDRTPAVSEVNGWLDAMHNGDASGVHYTREMVLVGFAESPENIANTAHAGWLIQV
jgi:serralysin